MSATVIEGRGVTKAFGSNVVLDAIDFTVEPGITGLLGANGSGKTTLMSMILGIAKRDDGQLSVMGADPQERGAVVRARIGFSPEHHQLPPDMPAADFVRHIAEVHGMPTHHSLGRASDALFYTGLGEERNRPLGTLSTGQRQRVKIAMAIAHDPSLVLLDEPTDGLDPNQREAMLDLIKRLSADFSMSVLLSSHLLEEVERTCERVVILADNKVRASGPIAELRGEGRGLSVSIDGDPRAVVAALTARGVTVAGEGAVLIVTSGSAGATQEQLMDMVRDAVAEAGSGIRSLSTQVMTLEDVFLGAV